MTIPRKLLVDRSVTGFYHCVSRCVRRAFLCGDGFEHRKDWIRDRLRHLSEIFAIDVAAYAVMSNHFHVVVRTDPDGAEAWSPLEVVTRWSRLFPASVRAWATAAPRPRRAIDELTLDRAVQLVANDTARVAVLRERLADLSWFMKCVKEPVARRANREDGCTGCFWEGRFKSPRLLDEAAVLTGMVYVDLNPIRAESASTPEQSKDTSVQERIRVRQLSKRRHRQRKRSTGRPRTRRGSTTLCHAEDGIWLAPIENDTRWDRQGVLPMTVDDYLTVVDTTGRIVREGKSGFIPSHLPPILERLKIEATAWATAWGGVVRVFGTAIGSAEERAAEAKRRGVKRVLGSLRPSSAAN